jgi:hypothetical protein
MSVIIRAHFDGRAIIPDSQLDLPPDQPMEVEVRLISPTGKTAASPKTASGKHDITSLPFFGMWADRKDMADSRQWVRKEREQWKSRVSGTD